MIAPGTGIVNYNCFFHGKNLVTGLVFLIKVKNIFLLDKILFETQPLHSVNKRVLVISAPNSTPTTHNPQYHKQIRIIQQLFSDAVKKLTHNPFGKSQLYRVIKIRSKPALFGIISIIHEIFIEFQSHACP